MIPILPDRNAAARKGWTHQVQWKEEGRSCFVRVKSGREADSWADKLKKQKLSPVVIDLADALRLH
jgi:hypothetical protein